MIFSDSFYNGDQLSMVYSVASNDLSFCLVFVFHEATSNSVVSISNPYIREDISEGKERYLIEDLKQPDT